ncbi:alpha-protein kinase vwkA [Elysia marginata]|uniref:Alpha-protein kinase vwkA n=1 Tax=Elysia marginata TaxID=1093978 RepID=A0AAV4FG01_9GAST|nr:alpha-protein kinase vwkA [Elysia marginata]
MPIGTLETFESSPDKNNNRHRVSIDALTSKRHEHSTTYEGRIFSFGGEFDHRDRILVVVKCPAAQHIDSDTWAQSQLQISKLVRKHAAKFNEYVRHSVNLNGTRIYFLNCQMATIDSTSRFDRQGKKKGDSIVFEDKLGDFSQLISTTGDVKSETGGRQSRRCRGKTTSRSTPIPIPSTIRDRRRSNSIAESNESQVSQCASSVESSAPPSYEESQLQSLMMSYPKVSESQKIAFGREIVSLLHSLSGTRESPSSDRIVDDFATDCDERDVPEPILQAFVHFFFCHTSGQAVVCGLKGTKNEMGYELVTPVLHSLGRLFGERDGGEPAMRKVLKNHRCSSLCHHLPDVFSLLSQAKKSPRFDWDYV